MKLRLNCEGLGHGRKPAPDMVSEVGLPAPPTDAR
jgi:hypothetical protein